MPFAVIGQFVAGEGGGNPTRGAARQTAAFSVVGHRELCGQEEMSHVDQSEKREREEDQSEKSYLEKQAKTKVSPDKNQD